MSLSSVHEIIHHANPGPDLIEKQLNILMKIVTNTPRKEDAGCDIVVIESENMAEHIEQACYLKDVHCLYFTPGYYKGDPIHKRRIKEKYQKANDNNRIVIVPVEGFLKITELHRVKIPKVILFVLSGSNLDVIRNHINQKCGRIPDMEVHIVSQSLPCPSPTPKPDQPILIRTHQVFKTTDKNEQSTKLEILMQICEKARKSDGHTVIVVNGLEHCSLLIQAGATAKIPISIGLLGFAGSLSKNVEADRKLTMIVDAGHFGTIDLKNVKSIIFYELHQDPPLLTDILDYVGMYGSRNSKNFKVEVFVTRHESSNSLAALDAAMKKWTEENVNFKKELGLQIPKTELLEDDDGEMNEPDAKQFCPWINN